MNLSAQDHQTFFTCEADAGKPEYERKSPVQLSWHVLVMQMAWRERNPEERIKKAKEALVKNPECTTALILLAEEDCCTILEVCSGAKKLIYVLFSDWKNVQASI